MSFVYIICIVHLSIDTNERNHFFFFWCLCWFLFSSFNIRFCCNWYEYVCQMLMKRTRGFLCSCCYLPFVRQICLRAINRVHKVRMQIQFRICIDIKQRDIQFDKIVQRYWTSIIIEWGGEKYIHLLSSKLYSIILCICDISHLFLNLGKMLFVPQFTLNSRNKLIYLLVASIIHRTISNIYLISVLLLIYKIWCGIMNRIDCCKSNTNKKKIAKSIAHYYMNRQKLSLDWLTSKHLSTFRFHYRLAQKHRRRDSVFYTGLLHTQTRKNSMHRLFNSTWPPLISPASSPSTSQY